MATDLVKVLFPSLDSAGRRSVRMVVASGVLVFIVLLLALFFVPHASAAPAPWPPTGAEDDPYYVIVQSGGGGAGLDLAGSQDLVTAELATMGIVSLGVGFVMGHRLVGGGR